MRDRNEAIALLWHAAMNPPTAASSYKALARARLLGRFELLEARIGAKVVHHVGMGKIPLFRNDKPRLQGLRSRGVPCVPLV